MSFQEVYLPVQTSSVSMNPSPTSTVWSTSATSSSSSSSAASLLSNPYTSTSSNVSMMMNMSTMNMTTTTTMNCTMDDSFNFLCNKDSLGLTLMLLKSLTLCIIILLTICGNVLVLMAVALSPNLRSSTHYLIVNLAVADLLLGTTVLPFSAVFEITDKWYFGETFCTVWASIDVLYCTASILSLCVISLDRYIGVTRPLAYSTIMVGRRTWILMVLIWVLSIAISIGPLLGWKGPPSTDPYGCAINKQLGYVLFSVTGSFYLPMLIILIVYWRIYKAAARQTKFLECGTKTTKQDVTLRIHLGGANGRAGNHGSTPDLAFIRPGTPKQEQMSPPDQGGNGNGIGIGGGGGGGNGSKHSNSSGNSNSNRYSVRNLAPLARPEISSSSSHNNEECATSIPPGAGHNNLNININSNNANGLNQNKDREGQGQGHGEEGVILRVHRGGSKHSAARNNYSTETMTWTCLTSGKNGHGHGHGHGQRGRRQNQNQQVTTTATPLNNGYGQHHHHHNHNQGQGQGHGRGSQANSLTPSPPSSSPERGKINPGFGKIAKFKRQKKAAKTLAVVVGVFLACWFPFFFTLPLDALCGQVCNIPSVVFDLFFWLGYFNSCLNPFIYASTSREFKRAFRRILCRRSRHPGGTHISRAIYRANIQSRYHDRQCNGNGNGNGNANMNPNANAIALHQMNHQWS